MRNTDFPSTVGSSSRFYGHTAEAGPSGSWDHAQHLEEGMFGRPLASFAAHVPSVSYAPVVPNRTTNLCGSWPCEKIVADIENKTSLAILMDKYDEVCARLMQAKKNRKVFQGLASLELATVLLNVLLVSINSTSQMRLQSAVLATAGVVSAIPHMGVAKQFQRIKMKCDAVLRSQFGDQFVAQIEGLGRDEQGFLKAIQLLREQNCSSDFLEQKFAEFQERGFSHSWIAQVLMDVANWSQ